MFRRSVIFAFVFALALMSLSLVFQPWVGPSAPLALADPGVTLDVSTQSNGGNSVTIVIGVLNKSGTDADLSRVTGSIPPTALLQASWTGTITNTNPGKLEGQQVSWYNLHVAANSGQGPFFYTVSLPSGSAAYFHASATAQNPALGTTTSADVLATAGPVAVPGVPVQSVPNTPDFALPTGRTFKQANGQNGAGSSGFAVVDGGLDSHGNTIKMYTAYTALGGTSRLGFPISRRYKEGANDDFMYQAFQNGVLQWDPNSNSARLTNLMDAMHDAQLDPVLQKLGYAPWEADSSGGDYAKARAERLGWLNDPAYADFKQAYFDNPDPETFFGLPASHPQTMGWIRVLRLQRAVFATYNNGPVQMASVGDDAKKVGYLTGDVIRPQSPDEPDLAAWMFRSPALSVTAASPFNYKYREDWIETGADCNNTFLEGDLRDVNGNPVNGELVRTWNDWGNEFFTWVGLNQPVGFWQRMIGPGIRPGVWHAQVVHPQTKAPLSPVSTVAFTDSCTAGGVQRIRIHFKANQ